MAESAHRCRWIVYIPVAAVLAAGGGRSSPAAGAMDRHGKQWTPFLEWRLENPTFEGNPFDLAASATFVHKPSGERRTTGMFHDGGRTWKLRFTATRAGTWTFMTSSRDPDLGGRSGTVVIEPNPGIPGFVVAFGSKWGRSGTDRAFVPQLVMFASPDRRTFEALELLITRTHAAGGMVHIWAWGDEARKWTPNRWGKNGRVDRRLQRPTRRHFVFYREDAASIRIDLSGMRGPEPAVAVDACQPYAELGLGTLAPKVHTWRAPHKSDWAIAVGVWASEDE